MPNAAGSCITVFVAVVLVASLVGCGQVGVGGQAGTGAITIGLQSGDAAAARTQYAPFLDLLSGKMGRPISLATYKSLADLGGACRARKVDFVLVSPTSYVALADSADVTAIATKCNKGGTPYCQGTLIAEKGKGITCLADLKGKRFRYGPNGSFNKYYAALIAFKKAGLDPAAEFKRVSYGTGCGGIAKTILDGEADAGVVCDYSWDGWAAAGSFEAEKLSIIGRGPKLRDSGVAAASHVSVADCDQLVQALLATSGDPMVLAPPLKAKGFVRSTDRDYDALRQILTDLGQR